jgi:hypothetical protein
MTRIEGCLRCRYGVSDPGKRVLRGKVDYSPHLQRLRAIVAFDFNVIARLRQRREIPLTPVLAPIIGRRGSR